MVVNESRATEERELSAEETAINARYSRVYTHGELLTRFFFSMWLVHVISCALERTEFSPEIICAIRNVLSYASFLCVAWGSEFFLLCAGFAMYENNLIGYLGFVCITFLSIHGEVYKNNLHLLLRGAQAA